MSVLYQDYTPVTDINKLLEAKCCIVKTNFYVLPVSGLQMSHNVTLESIVNTVTHH